MLGWFSDFFRLWWGMVYWNLRKTWFRLRRGRVRCPCQNPSDSGRARETGCEACIGWAQPARFQRVCPLLVETTQGLRCAADTADVRPFWGIAFRYYGIAALALYLAGAVGVFAFLRTVGYPISIVHVTWPGLWYRVPQARGWFFMDRSNRAFAAGRTAEGILYLENAYEFDPRNYAAGLALAKHYQAGQPVHSDEIFQRLIREHPDLAHATAQEWFRALLARGDFTRVQTLAHEELLSDRAHAAVWLRALLVATHQTANDTLLRDLLGDHAHPALAPWRAVLATELLVRAGKVTEARQSLDQPLPANAPPFDLYYRINTLTALGDPLAAIDLLQRHPGVLGQDDVEALRLGAFATARAGNALKRDVDAILAGPLNLPAITLLCAHLIRHPDVEIFAQLMTKVGRSSIPLNTESAGAWFSLLCTAGAVHDDAQLHALAAQLKQAAHTPFLGLTLIESFFRGETVEHNVTTFLPLLPLPLEVNYALIERYAPEPTRSPSGRLPRA